MNSWLRPKDNMGDDPPFLPVGTEVSAKYRGAFCEAKISKVVRSVKYKVLGKSGTGGATFVPEDRIRGNIRLGGFVEVKNDKSQYIECSIVKVKDLSQYTVVFNDGDIATLRRTALCLKSGRHFAESETLDQLPLTHPEHFSTPVISSGSTSNASNRRGRRNRMDDDSEDEELVRSKSKQSKSKPEKEADIGKVVCVELSDNRKKLSRDNWFPGLIVCPTAQNTAVKIQVKNEYLIRSFKDGRYYTVPKKETQEFTRDIANRVENSSLKTAVDKALLFLDKDELPPHWDRELIFGLGDSGSSDSDNSFDSDSSDDEPREEKDHFVAQLYKFMDDRGTPINKGPHINFKDIDLYKLFKVVHKLGGYNRVTNQNQWRLVAVKIGFKGTGFVATVVKYNYKRFLHSFEDFYRKLGCTMLSNPRSNRSRSRSGRSLIRDKDRLTPVQRDKSNEDKDSKDDSSSDRKDEDSDERDRDRDSDTKPIKDVQSPVVKSSIKSKDEKSDKGRDEKSKSESDTKVTDEESKKEEKKIRTIKSNAENSPRSSEKSETDTKPSKKDLTKSNKDDKDSLETKDGGKSAFKTDRDSRMSKKLSALEESKDKKPKFWGKYLKKKNPKNAEKGAVKDPLSTLQNTRRKRNFVERVKEISKKFKLKKSGQQDITKVLEEECDVTVNAGQSQKTSDSEASGKQSTRSKLKEDTSTVVKSRKQSVISTSGNPPTMSAVPDSGTSEKKSSSSNVATSNVEVSSSSSGTAKSKKVDDDSSNSASTGVPSMSSQAASAAESAKKKLGKKKKDEETKPGTSSAKDDSKMTPTLKSVSIGDKLKVYYGPPTQDSKKVTYEAKVLNIKENRNASADDPSKLYLVHYTGWNTRYDEWIPLSRIADNLTGHADSENSGTEASHPKSTNDGKPPSKSAVKSAIPPSGMNKNKSPGNTVRPPSSRLLAKKTRTRKISLQNTDGSESENDFPEMEDSATRTDDSDDDNDFQNTSEVSASSLAGSEITTRSRREKQKKVPVITKDSDNSNDSKKKEDTQSRLTKKPGLMKRKNSDPAMKTKWIKEEDEEEETEDWQNEPRKKNKSKAEEEDASGSARKKKTSTKDSDEVESADNSSTSKKKISTRSNKDSSFEESSQPEAPAEKTPGSSGKKITTRSTVIKRSPRSKSSLYVDEIDEDADVEDDDEDNDPEPILSQKKGDIVSSAVGDKKGSIAEKDKDSSSKKISKSKSPISSSISDVKEDNAEKKKPAKPEEDSAKKEEKNVSSPIENIYQRRYSGRRSTHLKNKLNRSENDDKLETKISPKGREYDLVAIRSELKGLSKTAQGLDGDDMASVASDDKTIDEEMKPLMGSSFEDDNDQSMETITDSSLTEDGTKVSSAAEKKGTSNLESLSKKPASSLDSKASVSSDLAAKKPTSLEPGAKKSVAESSAKSVSATEPTKKSEVSQKKTALAESVSKKISSTEFVPKKSVSPTESTLKKLVSAQETTPKKSAPELSKKKGSDSSVKKPDSLTPNRFAVAESSSDVDDIYEFKDSDPFEFTECRSKTGSSDEKNPSKLTPRRPVGPGASTISSSPKVDSHDGRNVPVSTVTPKKKPFPDSLSSPPPLVSISSEVPSVTNVTTSSKRKINDDSTTSTTHDALSKKKAPTLVPAVSNSGALSEKSVITSKVDAVKSSLFDGPSNQSSDKAKPSEVTKAGVDHIKVEPIDVKPVITEDSTEASTVSDLASRKDKYLTSAQGISSVIKTEVDKLETKKPISAEKIDLPEPNKSTIDSEKLLVGGDSKIIYDSTVGRKNQKTFGKQPVYGRDNKYPPPLVPSKSTFSGTVTEDKTTDSKSQVSSTLDSKVSAFDNSRTKLSPILFSGANVKSTDSADESIDEKPIITEAPPNIVEKASKDANKGSINGISAEVKSVEILTPQIKQEKPVSSSVTSLFPKQSSKDKFDESDTKGKDVLVPRKDYSSKQRKPVLSKEFINEDSSSSDSSDVSLPLPKKVPKTTPTSSGRNFQSIFDSTSSSNDDDDDNNDDDNNDDEDEDNEGNLQICLDVSSQEDIKKAIIGEDHIDDDNDADDDDDGDDDDDDDDDEDDEDDDDDDSRSPFISRKEQKPVSAKKQDLPGKDKMDSLKDQKEAKHILSKEMDIVDEKSCFIKEEKDIKKEDFLDKNEVSDENDFIDNELLCEEIIPKSPPPSGALVDCGPVKLSSNKNIPRSKEMPFASALSSNCSYSASDKLYSSSKNLSMFPPKTIKTLQPSSSKFRSSSSTNNDRKEMSSEPNDGGKVLLMDITPPMTPENCLSPVSNSPTDDQSNSSPAHLQDDVYTKSTLGLKASDYNDDAFSSSDIKTGALKKGLDSVIGGSRKRRRSETDGGSSSRGPYSNYDAARKKIRSNQQSPRTCGSDSDDGSEPGTSTLGSSPSNSSITKPSKNNFFVELDPELDGTQRIAILQQKLQDLRKTYMNLKQELACIDRRRKKICRREREEKSNKGGNVSNSS